MDFVVSHKMWKLEKSAIFSQKITNMLFCTYMMNHWWYQLCSAFIIDNVSLEGLCAIFYSKARGRHILQNYFFKRERFRWIIHSLLVDFPEPWCVIYEVFLILWRHTHYHCFVDFCVYIKDDISFMLSNRRPRTVFIRYKRRHSGLYVHSP